MNQMGWSSKFSQVSDQVCSINAASKLFKVSNLRFKLDSFDNFVIIISIKKSLNALCDLITGLRITWADTKLVVIKLLADSKLIFLLGKTK